MPPVEKALTALAAEIGLLVVASVLPAPPSKLVRLGDREIRNCAPRWSSVLETPLRFALPAPAVAGAVAGGIENVDPVAGTIDTVDGVEDWGDWAAVEPLGSGFEPALGATADPATFAAGAPAPAPAASGAAPAEFHWFERAGLDGGEAEAACEFDAAWFVGLDEAEPDCTGGVAVCWLDTVGLDGVKDAGVAAADETRDGDDRIVASGSRAGMRGSVASSGGWIGTGRSTAPASADSSGRIVTCRTGPVFAAPPAPSVPDIASPVRAEPWSDA
jgi:hypothetical protein